MQRMGNDAERGLGYSCDDDNNNDKNNNRKKRQHPTSWAGRARNLAPISLAVLKNVGNRRNRTPLAWPRAFVLNRSERATCVPLDNNAQVIRWVPIASLVCKLRTTKKHIHKCEHPGRWSRLSPPLPARQASFDAAIQYKKVRPTSGY